MPGNSSSDVSLVTKSDSTDIEQCFRYIVCWPNLSSPAFTLLKKMQNSPKKSHMGVIYIVVQKMSSSIEGMQKLKTSGNSGLEYAWENRFGNLWYGLSALFCTWAQNDHYRWPGPLQDLRYLLSIFHKAHCLWVNKCNLDKNWNSFCHQWKMFGTA